MDTNNMIDWDGKLEAVHEDGRISEVRIIRFDEIRPASGYALASVDGLTLWYLKDGRANIDHYWTIRNKPAAVVAPEAIEKPAEAPLGVLTGAERLERLEAFVRRLAKGYHAPFVRDDDAYTASDALKEARAIVAELPEPVDPDLVEARQIANEHSVLEINYTEGKYDHHTPVQSALSGLKRGRALERGEGK